MKNKMKQLFGIILSLVLVLGVMPGMSLTALAEDPYADLKNTTTIVKFDDKDWYLINYDSNTVTLLSKACVDASVFGSNTTYSGSTVEGSVNDWYSNSISANAKTAVDGNGAFLLSTDDVSNLSEAVLKCDQHSEAAGNLWWLCTPGTQENSVKCVNGATGKVPGFNYHVSNAAYGVRPAIKLNLSSVIFESQSNEFTVIKVDVTGVTLNKTAVTLNANGTETLTATVSPDDATDKTVTWSSDNTAVATVSDGVVTAVAEGTANITVTATNGTDDTSDDKTATCAVTVNAAIVTYAVTLNANGGTINSGNITEYTEGTGATLPTDVTKDGHQFGGWYDNAGLTGSPVTAISTSDTGNKQYWAKWTESQSSGGDSSDSGNSGSSDSGSTSGGDSSDNGNSGSSDSSSTSGGDSSDSGNSGSSDSGSTSGASSDSGSGSSSSGSSDNTNTNTDTSAKVPYDDVAISTGSVNDITGTASATAESNPFGTKIENSSNLTTLLSLTDAEVAQGVNVWLDIQDMSASVPQTDTTLIQNTSGDYTVGLYLDINLFKKVGSNDATKVTEINGKVKASIVIPESLWKSGRTFEIIRVHDGVATAIAGTYDENTHVFTFETDQFSTYALAYKDPASSSDSGTTSDSSSSDSSNSTQPTSPKTGDTNDVRVWYLLLIASLGGFGFLGYSKKKKVND